MLSNGKLLGLLRDNNFDALVTFDKNLQHQQNFTKYTIPVIVLHAADNSYLTLKHLVPKIKDLSTKELKPGPTETNEERPSWQQRVAYCPATSGDSRKLCKLKAMTTKEIKSEIQKALDNIPENALQVILEYLKELQRKPADQIKLAKNRRDILNEDKELLERLAR